MEVAEILEAGNVSVVGGTLRCGECLDCRLAAKLTKFLWPEIERRILACKL
jgi:hypothetical protein